VKTFRYATTFVIACVFTPGLAQADSLEDTIVDQLQKQGYSDVRVGRTLLGRTRIVAEGEGREREIVVNPRTGEILRDVWEVENTADLLDDAATPEIPADITDSDSDRQDQDGETSPGGSNSKVARTKSMV